MTKQSVRRCGAVEAGGEAVRFRVWAPKAGRVSLVLVGEGGRRREVEMRQEEGGYFSRVEQNVAEGQRYAYRLDGGEERQDPCSLWQPEGVPGVSAVVRPGRFRWTDSGWRGVRQEDLVVYELHVGTFTREGTFEAIIPRIRELKELGVTAIELMPVGQFPGGRNWGYDGVLWYAAQNTYGGPYGLAKLVDACHAEGMGVILDVVYNHFGPEGNFVGEFGPYFTEKYRTPWGAAVNYDDRGCDGVRDYVIDNARMWVEEFHLDGLRLDAVHAIYDLGARHILRSIGEVVHEVGRRLGRDVFVIAESDLNDPRIITPVERGGYGLDAQWADDFHHAVHTVLTGERRGYYEDYGRVEQVGRVFRTPYMFEWEYSKHRGRKHGERLPEGVRGDRFVVAVQNHDQVGNRARGDRLAGQVGDWRKVRLAGCLVVLSPYVPMLFMGEEYGETRPFPFFCSFGGEELVGAVRKGRKREFQYFLAEGEEIPDPAGVGTFESAKLLGNWEEGTVRGGIRRLYRDLLEGRREWAGGKEWGKREARLEGGVLEVVRGGVGIYFNLSGEEREVRAPGNVLLASEDRRYGGERGGGFSGKVMPWECVVVGEV